MPFPVSQSHIDLEEEKIGRSLPVPLRERLHRDNGDEIEVDDDIFYLHPVWDPTDKKRMKRSASHIARETAVARTLLGFPVDAVSVAVNDYGDRLILRPNSDTFEVWTRSDGATRAGNVSWFPEAGEDEPEEDEAESEEAEESGTLQAGDLVELQARVRIQQVLNWPVPRRIELFFDTVRETREAWTLGDSDGWVAKADDEGRSYLPIWPGARFAAACAGGSWSNTMPERILLEDWIERVTPSLVKRNQAISVFPSPTDGGGQIEPDAFLAELLRVLDF